jgi:hypothetical protein
MKDPTFQTILDAKARMIENNQNQPALAGPIPTGPKPFVPLTNQSVEGTEGESSAV